MNPITNAAALAQLATMNAAVLAFDTPIAAARLDVANLEERAEILRGRIADETEAATRSRPDPTTGIGEVLADDPNAELDADRINEAAQADGKAQAERAEAKIKIGILTASLEEVPSLITAAKERVQNLISDQSRAEQALIQASYQALVAEFRKRFVVIRDEVLTPLLAHVPLFTSGGSYLSKESLVQIRTYGARTALDYDDEKLLSFDTFAQEVAREGSVDVLDAFRATLPNAPAD